MRVPLDDLSSGDVVKACEENYIDYWKCIGHSRNAEFSESNGITHCVTGLPQEIFNVVLRCRLDPGEADSAIDKALQYYRSRRIPMLWHVGMLTEPKDVGMRLAARGFPHDYDLTAMAIDLDSKDTPSGDPGFVSVERVADGKGSDQWIECLTSSWESPREVGAWMRGNACFNMAIELEKRVSLPRRMYLGALEGTPAGACMLVWRDGVAGLQAVGTVPDARRKGVGRAVVEAALDDARMMGFGYVVVLSTIEGLKLYERCGFRAFGKLPEHSMYFDKYQQK